ncbi:MAG: M14 family metallopeptidase [Bacillota bacterium]
MELRGAYGYENLQADVRRLAMRHRFVRTGSAGRSVMGRQLPLIRIGIGPKRVHYNGAFHAHEWITAPLLVRFAQAYAAALQQGDERARRLFEATSLYLVPMVNPDGVELVINGTDPGGPEHQAVAQANGGADWEEERRKGPRAPAPRGYAGPSPLSEPEAAAMAELTREQDFGLVIAFHSQGEVIYWGYGGHEPPEAERIVGRFAAASGYQPVRYAGSGAGYKDWFIQEFGRPGFTVEVGRGVNPLPVSQFEKIWRANEPVMWEGLQVLAEEV